LSQCNLQPEREGGKRASRLGVNLASLSCSDSGCSSSCASRHSLACSGRLPFFYLPLSHHLAAPGRLVSSDGICVAHCAQVWLLLQYPRGTRRVALPPTAVSLLTPCHLVPCHTQGKSKSPSQPLGAHVHSHPPFLIKSSSLRRPRQATSRP
jgi:hypothetical protein